jgi:hypothetical protein
MPTINLPPGNRRLTFADGSEPVTANRKGHAVVTDEQAKMINSMRGNGEGGLINARTGEFGPGATGGRTCACSPTRYYEWTKACPRCGAETVPAA